MTISLKAGNDFCTHSINEFYKKAKVSELVYSWLFEAIHISSRRSLIVIVFNSKPEDNLANEFIFDKELSNISYIGPKPSNKTRSLIANFLLPLKDSNRLSQLSKMVGFSKEEGLQIIFHLDISPDSLDEYLNALYQSNLMDHLERISFTDENFEF